MKNNFTKNAGVATIELLIAFAILLINVTGVVMLVNSGQNVALDSELSEEALKLAETQIEDAKKDAHLDFNLVNPKNSNSPDNVYNKNLLVEQIDLFTKKITSLITWDTALSAEKNIEIVTYLTNPEAVAGGDTCSSVLAGDWTDPEINSYEFGAQILEPSDTSSGFPITSIQTFNHYLYATVNNDNGNNNGTFFILDISDPTGTPVFISGLDNSPEPPDGNGISEGLNAVVVDGRGYAYVANAYDSSPQACIENDNCSQLQVIDISNPYNPEIVEYLKINSITTGNNLAYGTSIFYYDNIVYLGLARATSGHEFFTIDVTNPTNPVVLDSYEIVNGVNAILVRDSYAYIASPNNSKELMVLDVSNPGNIFEPNSGNSGFNAPGGGGNNGNGKSLYIVGNKLYFGRTLLNGNEFYILDKTNPENFLISLGFQNILDGDDGQPPAPSNTSVNGVIVRQNLGFLITKEEFQIWDISDPLNITRYADPLILPPGSGGLQGTASDCEGNYIYVGSMGSNDKGYISIITGGDEE